MMLKPGEISGGAEAAKKLADLRRRIESKKKVYVGLPQGSGGYDTGETVVGVGVANEFGTRRIPERSFLRVPLAANKDRINNAFKRQMPAVLRGDITFDKLLETIGQLGAGISQEAISAGISPANAPSTIAKKGSGKNTLIDTGNLREKITYVVRDS